MPSYVRSTRAIILVTILIGGAASIPAASADTGTQAPADASTACAAEKPKKGGLKGLLSAAKRAGVSQMLVGQAGMLGGGRGGQIASAVAGTAIEAAAADTGQAPSDVAQVPAVSSSADCPSKPPG